jgi:hypothetical protein
VLAFDSPHLTTFNTAGLLSATTRKVVINNIEFSAALERTLRDCSDLGRHSNVWHLGSQHATKYLWAHKSFQPWGKRVPAQCPNCGIFNPWKQISVGAGNSQGYRVYCKNSQCDTRDGKTPKRKPYEFTVLKPQNSEIIRATVETGGTGSCWLKISQD